ncbi:hypothetical protein LVJ94_33365 [Pendulispora rubella]|uniref:Uncharacterized protein n=1 Tax=Pendulispora rubella TaxID=2741070 RepID=A0ABZ2KT05_9BACT
MMMHATKSRNNIAIVCTGVAIALVALYGVTRARNSTAVPTGGGAAASPSSEAPIPTEPTRQAYVQQLAQELSPPTRGEEALVLRQAALERFTKPVYIDMPNGQKIRVDDGDEQTAHLKVGLLKAALVKEKEKTDPAFTSRAEEELKQRRPREVSISWDDNGSGGQLEMLVEDARSCRLPDNDMDITATDLSTFPCLWQPNTRKRWEPDTKLVIHSRELGSSDAEWQDMLTTVKKELAARDFVLARR